MFGEGVVTESTQDNSLNRVTRLSFRVRHRGYIRWWDHGVLGIYCVYCVGLQGLPQTNNNLVISFVKVKTSKVEIGWNNIKCWFLYDAFPILIERLTFNSAVISRRVAGGGGAWGLEPSPVRSPVPMRPKWNNTLYRGLWRAIILSPGQPPAPWAYLLPPPHLKSLATYLVIWICQIRYDVAQGDEATETVGILSKDTNTLVATGLELTVLWSWVPGCTVPLDHTCSLVAYVFFS